MDEKSDDDLILELESLLKQGGRPTKEEKESVTLRISAPLARQAKIAYPDERSRIYEEALIRELRKDKLLPPPLDGISPKAGKNSAHARFNPGKTTKDEPAPDYYLDSPFKGDTPIGKILKEKEEKKGKKPKK